MNLERLAELIDLIYAAADEFRRWPQALQMLAKALECDSTAMRLIDVQDQQMLSETASAPLEEELATRYAAHFAAAERYLETMRVNGADEYLLLMNGERVAQMPSGDDATGDCGVVGLMFKAAERIVHIAIRCQNRPQGETVAQALPMLLPHLQRSLLIASHRHELESKVSSMEKLMSHFSSGVILIDGRGQVAFLNRRASEIVSNHDGLKLAAGQLITTSTESGRNLRHLLVSAVEQGRNGGRQIGAMSMQYGDNEESTLSLVAVPLHPTIHALAHEPKIYAALLVGSSKFASGLDPAVLQLLYKLTGAEARLALGLAMGKSLEQYCGESAIQISTARGYLKQVFQKTATNRQTELVCLLRSIPFYLKP